MILSYLNTVDLEKISSLPWQLSVSRISKTFFEVPWGKYDTIRRKHHDMFGIVKCTGIRSEESSFLSPVLQLCQASHLDVLLPNYTRWWKFRFRRFIRHFLILSFFVCKRKRLVWMNNRSFSGLKFWVFSPKKHDVLRSLKLNI